MNYTAIKSRTADMLSRKGQTVTLIGETAAVYDPAAGSTTSTPYSAIAKAVLLPMTPYRQQRDTNIRAGDEQMLLATVDTDGDTLDAPPLNATVTLADGRKYALVSIEPLRPDGTDLLFDCAVRGAG